MRKARIGASVARTTGVTLDPVRCSSTCYDEVVAKRKENINVYFSYTQGSAWRVQKFCEVWAD